MGKLAETDSADAELPDIAPGPTAQAASIVLANLELRGTPGLFD